MPNTQCIVSVATLYLALHAASLPAEDIDLFLTPDTTAATRPNVLIVMDIAGSNNGSIANTCGGANTKIDMEKCTIANLLSSSDVGDHVNIGLALFSASNPRGGFIQYAVRQMTQENKTALIDIVNNIDTANNAPYALSMNEAYLYFAGGTPYSGLVSGYDTAAYDGTTGKYLSPASDGCQKNYIIYIGNGGPDNGENSGNTPLNKLAGYGGDTTIIQLTPDNYESSYFDEYARFMYKKDFAAGLDGAQNIITYTIGVFDPNDNTKSTQGARALLRSAGLRGGGKYFDAGDSAAFTQALKNILLEVQAVNSVFAAVTLPVSVNVRGTYLNQVYMGVFRPDENANPRWMGNLKEYQLALDSSTNTAFLADVNGDEITNNATGFINPGVVSYWTHDSSFWSFSPSGLGEGSDAPDGDIVEKGAAAQWLRTNYPTETEQSARKLYTCTGACAAGSSLSAFPFKATNSDITTVDTGTASSSDLQDLIDWIRGQDVYDENGNGSTTDVRASIHGDVLHSRPAVINYNRYDDDNDVLVYYGANDGVFHAILGGQLQPSDSPIARRGGTEQWGFIPSEFFGSLKTLRDNSPGITTSGKPYFADGPIGVYRLDANNDGRLIAADGDKVYLYIGMRRGGRLLYALDVSDPAEPKFLWKRSSNDPGFAELGQTWSLPRPVQIKAFANPVLILGGGYDALAEDAEPQGAATMGRAILVLDATDGNLLWQAGAHVTDGPSSRQVAGMTYSIPSDVLAIDRDLDGYVDRLYAVDTGANLWRADIDDPDPENWGVTQLATLRGNSSAANARKFLYAPDLVYVSAEESGNQAFDALFLGSGDREHPFEDTITNRFYLIKDPNTGKSVPDTFVIITESDLYDATDNLVQEGTAIEQAAAHEALGAAKGWYVTLAVGEKVVGNAVTAGGTVFFGTNQPTDAEPGVCTNLGTARLYTLDYLTGAATLENDGLAGLTTDDRSTTLAGGGFPPAPVPAVVIVDGRPQQVVISGTQAQTPPSTLLGYRYRTYWHNSRDGQ